MTMTDLAYEVVDEGPPPRRSGRSGAGFWSQAVEAARQNRNEWIKVPVTVKSPPAINKMREDNPGLIVETRSVNGERIAWLKFEG